MSQLPLARGENFMVFVTLDEGTTYKPFAGQKTCSLSIEANYNDVANKNQGNWKDYQGGKKGWSATVDQDLIEIGEESADEYNFEDLQDAEIAQTKIDVVFAWVTRSADSAEPVIDATKRKYSGTALASLPPSAGDGETMSYTTTLKGCGELVITDPS